MSRTIGNYTFPTTETEAREWQRTVVYTALARTVLLVAITRIEGAWSCYCVPVPGINHSNEKHFWQSEGTKVNQIVAEAAFPQFSGIPYDY